MGPIIFGDARRRKDKKPQRRAIRQNDRVLVAINEIRSRTDVLPQDGSELDAFRQPGRIKRFGRKAFYGGMSAHLFEPSKAACADLARFRHHIMRPEDGDDVAALFTDILDHVFKKFVRAVSSLKDFDINIASPHAAAVDEFDAGRFQRTTDNVHRCAAWRHVAGFEIADCGDGQTRCAGEIVLRPAIGPRRSKLVRPDHGSAPEIDSVQSVERTPEAFVLFKADDVAVDPGQLLDGQKQIEGRRIAVAGNQILVGDAFHIPVHDFLICLRGDLLPAGSEGLALVHQMGPAIFEGRHDPGADAFVPFETLNDGLDPKFAVASDIFVEIEHLSTSSIVNG